MSTAFQPGAFQSDAFQQRGGVLGGAITGGLAYTNNDDSFSGAANIAAEVTGGWHRIWRKRRADPVQTQREPTEAISLRLERERSAVVAQMALDRARRRDEAVTAQLKAIYAEQDALAAGIVRLEAQQKTQERELDALLLLAS